MNCQDFTRVLEELDLHQLPAPSREAAEAHLAACRDCSSDLEVHQRLGALPIPPLSTARIAGWRALGASGAVVGDRKQRKRKRYVAVGVLVVAAAAAAMLGLRQEDPPAQAAQLAAEVATSPPMAETIVPAGSPVNEAVMVPVEARRVSAEPAQTAPRQFTLLVEPLEYETEDVAVRAAAEEFHTALLDGLREIPGLLMVGPDSLVDHLSRQTDFRITAVARAAKANQRGVQWEVMLRMHVLQGESRRVQPFLVGGMLAGTDCSPPAANGAGGCGGSAMAPAITNLLRGMMLPADPSLEGKLAAQVQDSALPPAERLRALEVLNCQRIAVGGTCPRRGQLGADVVRVALGIISSPGEASTRAAFVRALRGQPHADLVQPLVEIAHRAPEDLLRLEAVTSLAEDFSADVAAHSALELVAREDASELVRKVAARVVSGKPVWDAYAVATVRDTSMPDVKRLVPLEWMTGNKARAELPALLDQLLDGAGAHIMLAELLSAAQKESKGGGSAMTLISVLRDSRHSAAADFWLAMLDRNPDTNSLSGLNRHRAEERVRKKIEELAASHPDVKLREAAAAMLEEPRT
jgi:hypothetical protein